MAKKYLVSSDRSLLVPYCFLISLVIVVIYASVQVESRKETKTKERIQSVNIEVKNGCGEPDLAQNVSQYLLNMKINVITWGNTKNTNCIHRESMFIIRKKIEGTEGRLEYLQKKTGIKKYIEALKDNSLAEFELILGQDYYLYFKI